MSTSKADKLIRSLIDAGLLLTDFTILATKVMYIQVNLKVDHDNRKKRDVQWQGMKRDEQNHYEQQLKVEHERKQRGMDKLRALGYVTADDTHVMSNQTVVKSTDVHLEPYSTMSIDNSNRPMKCDGKLTLSEKEIQLMKQKQRDCCLKFNIDYDLRLNQQGLERACKKAKRNIYEVNPIDFIR
jgi:hypothetical protein